jgi:hypothetical protein
MHTRLCQQRGLFWLRGGEDLGYTRVSRTPLYIQEEWRRIFFQLRVSFLIRTRGVEEDFFFSTRGVEEDFFPVTSIVPNKHSLCVGGVCVRVSAERGHKTQLI